MIYSETIPYRKNAAQYFSSLRELPWAIWLDSGGVSRYDILVAKPFATLVTRNGCTEITDRNGVQFSNSDPFDLLKEKLKCYSANITDIPFCGGVLGFWGYDLARSQMKLPSRKRENENQPDMSVGFYDWAVLIDHQTQQARLVSSCQEKNTAKELPEILARLRQSIPVQEHGFQVSGRIQSNLTRTEYEAAIHKIQEYLTSGDCYQVNFAQRFSVDASGDGLEAYLKLRDITPAPYSAFLDLPGMQILCTSPEQFLSVQGQNINTKPIKGTRQRSLDASKDFRLKEDLQENAKDRAENLMIVDLLRNDLSKNCQIGSVKVDQLFAIESYANVHHMVSTISAKLASGKNSLTLLRDCFPGGSITGAPKKRAMEIIDELEPQARGVYCGSIGYIGWDGNMDTNIAIRTIVYEGGKMNFSVGGGIVADSIAAEEYQETLDKAAGIFKMFEAYGAHLLLRTLFYKSIF